MADTKSETSSEQAVRERAQSEALAEAFRRSEGVREVGRGVYAVEARVALSSAKQTSTKR